MRKEIKKAPTIRFQGFTDEWEQHKLGDVCNQLTGAINPQTRPNELFVEYSMPAYDSGMKPNIVYGFTMNSTRKIVNESCLLINKLNVRKKRIWYIKNPTKNTVCSAEFIPLCSDNIDLLFLNYVVSRDAFTNYLEDCSSGSSNSQKRVTPDIIIEAKVFLPVKDEQLRIGRYFQKIDNLITLHQRKLEQQKNLKKYFLQNMFPAKGEKVPKIRLKGFTGEWEQYKLGECLSLITYGFTNPMEDTDDGPWKVTAKDIADGQINYSSTRHTSMQSFLKLTAKSKPKKNDVLLTKDGTLGRTAIVKNENICINQSVALLRCNDRIMPEYLNIMLNSPRYKKEMIDNAGGGTIKHIYITKVDKMLVDIPSLEEQKNIARCFRNFDQLIIAQQHKLVELETLKKYILQNMLI